MHPLVPYLLGEKHPAGTRLTDVQKCAHRRYRRSGRCFPLHFLLRCWAIGRLGIILKKEAIAWSYEFLTGEQWLAIPKEKLYFTCFAGDENAPRDEESFRYWREQGVEEDHIFFLPKEHNWWGPAGITGPCGPDTEMFIVQANPPAGRIAVPPADVASILKSGTMSLCSIIKRRMALSSRLPIRMWIRAWGWIGRSASCRGRNRL